MRRWYVKGAGAVIFVGLALGACGDGAVDDRESTTTASGPATTTPATIAPPPTTAAVTTTVAPTSATLPQTTTVPPTREHLALDDVVGGTASGVGWLVLPGHYATTRAGTRMSFDLTEPAVFVDIGPVVTFGNEGVTWEALDIALFAPMVGVIPAEEVGGHPEHDELVPANTVAVPENLGDWLDQTPQLVVVDSAELVVGGQPATMWDVVVDASQGETFECDFGACVATLVSDSLGPLVMGDQWHFRLWQFDGAGVATYGFMQSSPAALAATQRMSDMIVGGLGFG